MSSDHLYFQLATGEKPYPELPENGIGHKVRKGRRPLKPYSVEAPGMTRAIWKIAEQCWHKNANSRPEAITVLLGLEKPALDDTTSTIGGCNIFLFPFRWEY